MKKITITMNIDQYQTIKDNLERKFKAILDNSQTPEDLFDFEIAYLRYVDENKILTKLFREIIFEDRILKKSLQEIFTGFMQLSMTKNSANKKIVLPSFLDKKIESKSHPLADFSKIMPSKEECETLLKKLQKKKDTKYNILDKSADKLISEINTRKRVAAIQQLHNEFIEKIDNKIPSKASRNLRLLDIPLGIKWNNVTIRWINGNDVEIKILDNFKKTYDYKELGFYDNKRKGPDMRWKILMGAASHNNIISWANVGKDKNSLSDELKAVNAFHQQILKLRKTLKSKFGIENNPLETFSANKEYFVKINLIEKKSNQNEKKEVWRESMDESVANRFEELGKIDYMRNPNQLATDEEADY